MRITVYRSGLIRREWRWRARAANGRIIAHGGEGYRNRADCLHAVQMLVSGMASASVTVEA